MDGTASIVVSAGELLDKITIVEIKLAKVSCAKKRALVEREHVMLTSALEHSGLEKLRSHELFESLKDINHQLWNVEDEIRTFDKAGQFEEDFIRLARSVYQLNDERSTTKRMVNDLVGSELGEVKEYSAS